MIRSSWPHQPISPWDADELAAKQREAWRRYGIALIRPEDIGDDWARQHVVNEMERRYGKRIEHAGSRG